MASWARRCSTNRRLPTSRQEVRTGSSVPRSLMNCWPSLIGSGPPRWRPDRCEVRHNEVMWLRLVVPLALVCASACGAREDLPADHRDAVASPSPTPLAQPAQSRPRIVALGDSLTAGLGLPIGQAYPALLQERLNKDGLKYDVVNAGVSGDTSAGGLS